MDRTGPLWGDPPDLDDTYWRCQPCQRLLTVEENERYGHHCLKCGWLATRLTRSIQMGMNPTQKEWDEARAAHGSISIQDTVGGPVPSASRSAVPARLTLATVTLTKPIYQFTSNELAQVSYALQSIAVEIDKQAVGRYTHQWSVDYYEPSSNGDVGQQL